MRKPSKWVRELQTEVGTTGGRGAQKVPASIMEVLDKAATLEFALAAMAGDEPSYWEAMAGPERGGWGKAMEEAIKRLVETNSVTLNRVERPQGANIVGCVWVLKKKRVEHNNVVKFKARLCAQGYSQIHGVKCDQTAAPTACLSSLRFVLDLAALNNWPILADLHRVMSVRKPRHSHTSPSSYMTRYRLLVNGHSYIWVI